MSKLSTFAVSVAALAVGAVSLGGCATTDFVNKQVAGVNSRVDANQASISAHDAKLAGHDARLGEIGKTAQDALSRAQAAGKLAEGKFLYQTVLSDDSVKFPVRGSDLSDEAKTQAEQLGELRRVSAPVSPHLEMTALCDRALRAGGPALLFENPTGHSMPVLGNLFQTKSRTDKKTELLVFVTPRIITEKTGTR